MAKTTSPTVSTVRKLFGLSMNRCAFDGCRNRIVDAATGVILGEICHINAKSKDGPRYLASQTEKERHAFENLILLCEAHHKVIDNRGQEIVFTSSVLREMKAKHESLATRSPEEKGEISADQVRTLIAQSIVYEEGAVHMDFRNSFLNAGGWGGGLGGGGGSGGLITISGYNKVPDGVKLDLNGKPGGIGGGGGGAGAVQFVGRPADTKDTARGLRISSIFAANSLEANGLLYVLGGAWSQFIISRLPEKVSVPLGLVLELGSLDAHTLIRIDIAVRDAENNLIFEEFLDAAVPENCGLTPRLPMVKTLDLQVENAGKFQVQVSSGEVFLACHDIEFRLRTHS